MCLVSQVCTSGLLQGTHTAHRQAKSKVSTLMQSAEQGRQSVLFKSMSATRHPLPWQHQLLGRAHGVSCTELEKRGPTSALRLATCVHSPSAVACITPNQAWLTQPQSFACACITCTCAQAILHAHLGKPVQGRLQSIPGYVEMIVCVLPWHRR